MEPGKLRQRIIFQRPDESSVDAMGAPVVTWDDYATVWAEVQPTRGRENWRGLTVEAGVTHAVRCRYNSTVNPDNLTPKDQISYLGRILSIHSIINRWEFNREIVCMCIEQVS